MLSNDDMVERIETALQVAYNWGQVDSVHHKTWTIDQMVRALTGDEYENWVSAYEGDPEDEDNHYSWDTGIAP
jgi:hypothetical protein